MGMFLLILVLFFSLGTATLVSADTEKRSISTLEDLTGLKAGVMTGTPQDSIVQGAVKDAELLYFDNFTDLLLALREKKIDFYINSTVSYEMIKEQYSDFAIVSDVVKTFGVGTIFPKNEKGEALKAQLDEFIAKITENGTLKDLQDYWLTAGEKQNINIPQSGSNGVLRMATSTSAKPFSYLLNNQNVGFDVALLALFCEEYDYGLSIQDMNFAAVLTGLGTGKYDLGAGQISYTEERAESVLYSDFYYTQELVAIIRAEDSAASASEDTDSSEESFWSKLKAGFNKSFIRENRWQLILSGLGTTMIITLGGFVLANILGALFCAMSLSKVRALNVIAEIYSWIMQGTPMVVVLMILYYVIFGHSSISGLAVSVIGFGVAFGAYMAQTFYGAITSIPKGQVEAALSLGFTKRRTFLGIIFPQAVRRMLPGYVSQLISLMKGTAVVGYVAVVDLTKVGDIIRSNTYEAFFPLIAVALIYLLVASLLLLGLKLIQKKLAHKITANNDKEAAA